VHPGPLREIALTGCKELHICGALTNSISWHTNASLVLHEASLACRKKKLWYRRMPSSSDSAQRFRISLGVDASCGAAVIDTCLHSQYQLAYLRMQKTECDMLCFGAGVAAQSHDHRPNSTSQIA
jgi:hypothetical protein